MNGTGGSESASSAAAAKPKRSCQPSLPAFKGPRRKPVVLAKSCVGYLTTGVAVQVGDIETVETTRAAVVPEAWLDGAAGLEMSQVASFVESR